MDKQEEGVLILVMQIKVLEAESVGALMEEANAFLEELDERDVVSINYQCNVSFSAEEQLDLYSVAIVYCVPKAAARKAK